MADLSAALASQSFVNDKQQRLQQPEVEQSQNTFAVCGSLKSSSVACPRPGVSTWDAGRVINSGAAASAGCNSNIGNHGRSRTSAVAPTPMSDPAKQQPLSSPAQTYRQATTGARTHRDPAEPVPPHSVAGSGGGCGRRPAWGRVAAGQQNSDDEEDFDNRPGDGHRLDDAEDDSESSGRLPNHLLDEIWTDMGVDAMDLDFYDFSADAGCEPLATTAADVKLPSSGAARWSPGPTGASGVAGNVPPSVALPAAAASAVGSLDVHRVDAATEVRRDRTADPVRPAPPLGQLGASGSLEWDAKDDFGQTSQRSGQESGQGAVCRDQRQQQQHQDERENIVDRKDAIFTEVALDRASPHGPRRTGSSAPPSNLGAATAGVSRESSVSPSATAPVTSALTSGTSPDDPANDRLNGGASEIRSTSDSLTAIAKLTRSISEAGNAGRSGSSDSGSVLDATAPYACRTSASAPDSTPAPSPGTTSCDSGSRSPAVHSPGQFSSGVSQDAAYGGSGSGTASRRTALSGRCSATQLSGNLRATEQLACELMGPQPAVAGGSSGAQHSRSQAMRTRGECSPYHVPSRPHSGGGGSSCACSAACTPSGLMAASPYHQQVPACNGRHENGRPLLGQAMPAAATGYQPYSSDNHGRHPAAVVSDGHRVGAAGLPANMQSRNGAGWAPPQAWRHHHARSSSIPDDLEMDDLTEPDRTINFSEKSQMPNYYQVPEHGGCSSGVTPAGISFNLSLGGASRSLQVPSQQQHNPRWPAAQPMPPSASLHQQQQSWQPAAALPQAWQQQQPFFPSGMPSLAPADGLQSAAAQQLEQQQPVHHVASSQPFASGYNSLGHHLPMQQLQLSRPEAAAATTFARGAVMHNAHVTNLVSEEPGVGSFPKMGQPQPGSQAGADSLSAADAPESFAVRPQPGSSSSSTHQQPQPPLPGTHCFMQRLIVAERTNAFRSHPLFPLLRDLVIAEMSFDDPSFPHQLIRDLPADFEKLLHNYLARNPVLLRGVPPANQAVESVVMDALHYAHGSLIEKLQVRASTTSDGSCAAKTQPPPPPPGYAAVSTAAAAGGGSACNGFDSNEPQRWMQARFGLQDAAASGQSAGAQVAAAFSVVAGRAAAADLMYSGRDGLKAENCNGAVAHSATQQCQMVRYENDAGRANYYNTIERPADSSSAIGGVSSLASSQAAAPGAGGLVNGHGARNDTPGRDVLLEQVQLQQRLQLQQMAAGGRSGAERSHGSTHFYAAPSVGGDRPTLQPARFGSAAVSASTHQAGGFGAYPVNGDVEASAQRARNGPLAERLSQQHHGYRQSPPSSADVASCRHGQAAGTPAGGHMGSPSGSDASMSAEALSPPSPSAMRMSSFAAAALARQQQQELQHRAVAARYDRNLGSSSASPSASMMSSMASDCTGSAAAAATAARKHQSLPKEAVNLMTEWLREHQDKPYPNDDEKCAMIKQTGLSMQQINYWFTNARRRLLRRWQQGSADGQPPVDC